MKHLSFLFLFLFFYQPSKSSDINVKNIEIKRDIWGVPHIFGQTDEEVAYGLAWATAEDDPISMQQNVLVPRSRLGEHLGKDGAIVDYIVALFEIQEIVHQRYDTDLSDKLSRVMYKVRMLTTQSIPIN